MKKIRRWMATLLIFTMVLSGNILVVHGEIPSATKEFYVNDYAGVFSDSWKETLCEAGKQLHDDTTAQLGMQFLPIKKIILKKVLCNFIMHC